MSRKDIHWSIDGVPYVVRNVPYIEADYDHEELLDLGTVIRLEMIGKLMIENEVPHDVDYNDVEDINI